MVWGLGLRSRLLAAAGVAVIMGAYSDAPAKAADLGGDWSVGYRMKIETITAQSNLVNQFNPGDDPSFGLLNVRHSYMYLDNKRWGQVRWGLTATPIYNITKDTNVTELEDTMHSDNRRAPTPKLVFPTCDGRTSPGAMTRATPSYARRARTASRIGRPNGTPSPAHGARSKTTCGAAPSATRKSGARTGTSALASVTRRRPTSGC